MAFRRGHSVSREFEGRFIINCVIGGLTGFFAILVVTYLQRLLPIAACLGIALFIFVFTARRRRSATRRVAGAMFVGGAAALGIAYVVWGSFAEWKNIQSSELDGGVICRTTQGIAISGPINSHSAIDWKSVFTEEARSQALPVFLNSVGGNLQAARTIAEDIAGNHMQVVVARDATCQSACTTIFAAGSQRFADPKAFFMFHGSRNFLQMPYLPVITREIPDDPAIEKDFRAFPVLVAKLKSMDAFASSAPKSGSAQGVFDHLDPNFLTLREVRETPSCKAP